MKTCCVVVLLAFSLTAAAQDNAAYRQRLAVIHQNIQQFFYDSTKQYYKEFDKPAANDKSFSYLWPLCALIQAANEMETAGMRQLTTKQVLKAIQAYADTTGAAPAYASCITALEKADRFYDDNQWIGIACMDAYERTHDKLFLAEGEKIYQYMMTGYDTVTGGGLYWKDGDFTTKNTCSNAPGVILALQLYKATRNTEYLQTALSLYEWTNKHLLSPQAVYYDNVRIPAGTIDTRTYTYNTGTMLQSNVLLYEITKQQKYLTEAKRLAEGAYTHFFRNGRFPQNAWFNAVLLRGYLALYPHDNNPKYIDAFKTDAEAIWTTERDSQDLFGRKTKKQLIDQAAMLEIYARLLNVK